MTTTPPKCEICGEPKTPGMSAHGPGHTSWYCRPCVVRLRAARTKSTEPPICECGLAKEKISAGRGHGTYWGCKPCRNRKSLEAYNARKVTAALAFKAADTAKVIAKQARPTKPRAACWMELREYQGAAKRLGIWGIV